MPNINTLAKSATAEDYLIKLDLNNGFFHINLRPTASKLIGVEFMGQFP